MSLDEHDAPPELVRWTFTVNPDHSQAIESHLDDLGADVWVRDEGKFQVTWEEPEGDLEAIVEALWSIHGEPFEVTQEDFRRLALHVLHHDDGESEGRDAA